MLLLVLVLVALLAMIVVILFYARRAFVLTQHGDHLEEQVVKSAAEKIEDATAEIAETRGQIQDLMAELNAITRGRGGRR